MKVLFLENSEDHHFCVNAVKKPTFVELTRVRDEERGFGLSQFCHDASLELVSRKRVGCREAWF